MWNASSGKLNVRGSSFTAKGTREFNCAEACDNHSMKRFLKPVGGVIASLELLHREI